MSPVQPCCRLWCQRQLSRRWMSRTNHGQSQAVERSILSFPGERCSVLREVLIVLWFAPLSRVCRSDPASDGNEDLGRRGRDRYASRLRWAQRTSADGSSATTILGACVFVSGTERRHRQVSLVGWGRSLSVRQAIRARQIYLAEG